MDLVFRPFQRGDTAGIVTTWTAAAPQDPITEQHFRDLILLDPNFDRDGLMVATLADRVVGSAYAVRRLTAAYGSDLEPDRGWISYLCVAPELQRRGIGTELVRRSVNWLVRQGVTTVDFSSYTPNYFLPGLDSLRYPAAASLFAKLEFTPLMHAAAMDLDLAGYATPKDVHLRISELRKLGYSLELATGDDLPELVDLATTEFNPDWGRAIREAVLNGLSLEQIWIARSPARHLLGWAMYGTYDHVLERFGPFGVAPASRGLKLGEVLLHLCLHDMQVRGAKHAWFLWTSAASPAGHLYLKAGFRHTRTFDILRHSPHVVQLPPQ